MVVEKSSFGTTGMKLVGGALGGVAGFGGGVGGAAFFLGTSTANANGPARTSINRGRREAFMVKTNRRPRSRWTDLILVFPSGTRERPQFARTFRLSPKG